MADKTGAFSYEAVFTAKDPVIIGTYEVCGLPDDNIVLACTHADCFCPPPPEFGCPLEPGEELVMHASSSLLNPSENGYVTVHVYLCDGGRFQVTTTVVPWVPIEAVTVGNPGNANDTHGDGYGAVDYVYHIGKYEVTAGEYAEFLNAVAAEDTYGLYNTNMWIAEYGCNIERIGSSPSYSYSVASDWADRPVNFISWGDAARFANWLHNGQPTGVQDLSTTEGGSYYLNGATSNTELLAVVRELEATWVIPSEDEWYKAAYHCNDGVTGNYYDYPTSSDTVPSKDLAGPDSGNNATFNDSGYTIGSPYYRTEAGAHENSESPCGTFDQGGNVFEWNEAILYSSFRGLRGGSFSSTGVDLHAALRNYYYYPTDEIGYFGFRVAEVPVLDFNGNGTVDLYDFGLFQAGFGGDVDLHYFAWLQANLTGP